jgi:hypothetical protein
MDDLTPLNVHKDWNLAHETSDHRLKLMALVRFIARRAAEHDHQQALNIHYEEQKGRPDD